MRIDKAFSWDAPMASHGMMHSVIPNAWKGDPYNIELLFMYMANMAWNSSMDTADTIDMLTDKDEETGEYNVSHIRRYVRNQRIVLVSLVQRVQGFIVPQGNPTQIQSLDELTREGVVFVNRQRGSGTRVLLDYKLAEAGIDPASIAGYQREEYTHLAVAAAVAGVRHPQPVFSAVSGREGPQKAGVGEHDFCY